MQTSTLREKTKEQLQEILLAESQDYFRVKMQICVGQLNKVHLLKEGRKKIARLKTLINEKR